MDPTAPPKVDHQHSGFTVSVRVKPLDSAEESAVTPHSAGHIELQKGSGESKIYSYDFVHWSTGDPILDSLDGGVTSDYASQSTLYTDIGAPLVENARDGFNCTLFAFGQTGSGEDGEEQGLVPRICRQLLSTASTTIDHVVACTYEVSYVEIYVEKVRDLLSVAEPGQTQSSSSGGYSSSLRVREHPETGPFVEGCRVERVEGYEDISRLMAVGNKRRKTASTEMNERSSRSHAIFVLTLTQDRLLPGGKKYIVISKINLVDLAGSENARLAGSTGEQLKEGAAINKSLLTLGRVIKALAAAAAAGQKSSLVRRRSSLQSSEAALDGGSANSNSTSRATTPPPGGSERRGDINGPNTGGKRSVIGRRASIGASPAAAAKHRSGARGQSLGGVDSSNSGMVAASPAPLVLAPPYRDSVLTYLLRDSLGGNSKTTLVATIRPGVSYQEETGVTLTYASQARTIVNIVHVNENPFVAAIKTLQKQVDELKKNLEIANGIIAASATATPSLWASSSSSSGPQGLFPVSPDESVTGDNDRGGSFLAPSGRVSGESVHLASWLEDETEGDIQSKKRVVSESNSHSSNRNSGGAESSSRHSNNNSSLRTSTPLDDITEEVEEGDTTTPTATVSAAAGNANKDDATEPLLGSGSSKALTSVDNNSNNGDVGGVRSECGEEGYDVKGVVEGVGCAVSDQDHVFDRSTDSDSSSEADIDAFKAAAVAMDDVDVNHSINRGSRPDHEHNMAGGDINDADREGHAPATPIRSPGYPQTWASVSSCHAEEDGSPTGSPIIPHTFNRSIAATPERTMDGGIISSSEDVIVPPHKCGFLLKRGFINTSYKLRYFKIEHNSLVFYKKSTDSKRRGSIYCAGATVDKRRGDALDPGTPFAFTLSTPNDIYHDSWTLQATSERERDDWILVINTVAGLPVYQGTLTKSPGHSSSTMAAVGKATCCVS